VTAPAQPRNVTGTSIVRKVLPTSTRTEIWRGNADNNNDNKLSRHCERSEAIHREDGKNWIASSLRSSQ